MTKKKHSFSFIHSKVFDKRNGKTANISRLLVCAEPEHALRCRAVACRQRTAHRRTDHIASAFDYAAKSMLAPSTCVCRRCLASTHHGQHTCNGFTVTPHCLFQLIFSNLKYFTLRYCLSNGVAILA